MIQNVVRVLLVEDDEDDMLLTTQLLREIEPTRFDVHWVTEYAQALEDLCSDRFDICLADYHLGPHNGVDFVTRCQPPGMPGPDHSPYRSGRSSGRPGGDERRRR